MGLAAVLLFSFVGIVAWVALHPRVLLASAAGMSGIRSTALVLALLLAVTAHLHWRATGEAGGVSIGTAGWLLFAVSAVDLWSGPLPERGGMLFVRSAMSLTAAVLAYRAITGSEVDTHTRPGRQLLFACLGAVPVGLLAALLFVASSDPTLRSQVLHAMVAAAWGVAATFGLLRTLRGAPGLVGWVTLLASAIATSAVFSAIALVGSPGWLFVASAARTAGFLALALGSVYGLSRSTVARRRGLHQEQLRNQRQAHEHTAERERQTHELRNALLAIEGAALTLQRYREDLPSDERHLLDEAVTGGIHHLRGLLAGPTQNGGMDTVSVAGVAAARASLARSRGLDVEAVGRPVLRARCPERILVQVIDNLIANAERHACRPDRGPLRVDIEVAGDADTVWLRVRDNGPGVPADRHGLIFEPGVRLDPSRPGDGLGLHLSRQLARQCGGELRSCDDSVGGCFELTLPRAVSGGGGRIPDERQHGIEIVESAPRR